MDLALKRIPLDVSAGVPASWTVVYDALSSPSIFQSREWVQTWLEIYGRAIEGEWLVWEEGHAPVAVALVLRQKGKYGPFSIRLSVINTSCGREEDETYVEYNDILCLPHVAAPVAESLTAVLKEHSWDRLLLSGYVATALLAGIAERFRPCRIDLKALASPFVDLNRVREAGYEALVSANTRSQIRRSLKRYAERGPVVLTAAPSLPQAHDFLTSLARLHQASWTSRGAQGAFASTRFCDFHHLLVERLWPKGQADLLRVTAGDYEIGYLYNFHVAGKVYFYQSGLVYETDNRLKPGLVAHALAIGHYAAAGAVDYDFLAGDSRYKQSLATGERQMHWATVDRDNVKMRALRALAQMRHMLRAQGATDRTSN